MAADGLNLSELQYELRLAENVCFTIHENMVEATRCRNIDKWEQLNDQLRDAQAYKHDLENRILNYGTEVTP